MMKRGIDMKNKDQGKLGNGLAGMHLLSGKSSPKKYGYPDQGFIGTNKQLNIIRSSSVSHAEGVSQKPIKQTRCSLVLIVHYCNN